MTVTQAIEKLYAWQSKMSAYGHALGWNPIFGARIIDYGLSNEMIDKFYGKEEEKDV